MVALLLATLTEVERSRAPSSEVQHDDITGFSERPTVTPPPPAGDVIVDAAAAAAGSDL